MKTWRTWLTRLAGLFNPARRAAEFDAELESHLEFHIEDNLRAGMTPSEARRQAILQLGGLQTTRESYGDQGTIPFLDHFSRDLRTAFRQLRRNPIFALTSILILALGLGATISIFAFVDATLLQPIPYPNPQTLVDVAGSNETIPRNNLSYQDYLDLKAQNTSLASLDAYTGQGFLFGSPSGAQLVNGQGVTPGFFRTLGIQPHLGRDLDEKSNDLNQVLITYGAWHNRFGGQQNIIGQTVLLSGTLHTVIGVLPIEFQFAPAGAAEIWKAINPKGSCMVRRGCHNLFGIARLKDGISIDAARANLSAIASDLERKYPDSNRGAGTIVGPLSEEIRGKIRPLLLMLFGGASLLLLIAFVNVVSLLLERAESRRREFAVRGALGASSFRLASQFLAESLVLVTCATAGGLVLASITMKLLLGLIPAPMLAFMPFLNAARMGRDVLLASAALAGAALIVFALAPAAYIAFSKTNGFGEGSRGSSGLAWRRLGSRLVVFELVTAMVLLMAAGLLGKSLYRLLNVDLGFNPTQIASLEVVAPPLRYGKDPDAVRLANSVLEQASRLPGVQSIGISSQLPVSFNGNTTWIRIVGHPYNGEHNEVNAREVNSTYFTTIAARLAAGRHFTDADNADAPKVAMINRTFAKKFLPNEDPIGKQVGDTSLSLKSLRQIVGLVEDIRDGGLDTEIWPALYVPFHQSPDNAFSMVVRTTQSPNLLLPQLSSLIRKLDPEIGIRDEATMELKIDRSQAAYFRRSSATLVMAFAGLALLLSTIGLYGVISYSVQQRTREIGIRMALGAESDAVTRMVLREAGLLAGSGMVLGTILSLSLSTYLDSMLFGVKASDPQTILAVVVMLAISALLASYLPARRAARVNPLDSLRAE
jgi:macrolide transport system ATP-binding/permease protein